MSLDVDPALDTVVADLRGLGDRAQNLRPALRRIADDMRDLARDSFDNPRWAPLTDEYAARKARDGKGTRPGVYSRTLIESLTRRGARFHGETIRPDSVTVVTRAPHAHLFDQGRGGQRARPLLTRRLVDRRSDVWLELLEQYLLEGRT